MSELSIVAGWWASVQLVGFASLPLTARVFRSFPDRGWHFARPFGLMLVSLVFWNAAMLGVPNARWTVFAALAAVGAASWWAGRRDLAALIGTLRQHWRVVVAGEVFGLAMFAFCLAVRAYVPGLTANEKPMELAILNGVLRSPTFPPIDPWFAGQPINYYYFGYVVTAALARLTDTPSEFAFQLMLATTFGLAAAAAYGLAANLGRYACRSSARVVAAGFAGLAFVLLLSNLEPTIEALNAHALLPARARLFVDVKDFPGPGHDSTLFPDWRRDPNWWTRASRVVGTGAPPGAGPNAPARDYTINEFPLFSLLIGDLHPHVIALPFVLLTLALVFNLVGSSAASTSFPDPLAIGVTGLAIGALGLINTWSVVPQVVLLGLVLLRLGFRHRLGPIRGFGRSLLLVLAVAVVAGLVFLPFLLSTDLGLQASGWLPVRVITRLQQFLLFWGTPYFLVASLVLYCLRKAGNAWLLLAAVVAALGGTLWSGPVLGAVLPLAVTAAVLAVRDVEPSRAFILMMVAAGAVLIGASELAYVHDMYGGRTNTVFKFYFEAWLLLGLASGYALLEVGGVLWRAKATRPLMAAAWLGASASLIALCTPYIIGATMSRTAGFARSPTLDGLADFRVARPGDLAAIEWLRSNVHGVPVIAEATGDSYQAQFGRVSTITGLPTILGWQLHERLFRGSSPEIDQRALDVAALYGCRLHDRVCGRLPPDASRTDALLAKYRVTYLYLGPTERETYGADASPSTDALQIVYRSPDVTIFRSNRP